MVKFIKPYDIFLLYLINVFLKCSCCDINFNDPSNERLRLCENGGRRNLCGECGGAATGQDVCGICGGLGLCGGCPEPGSVLDPCTGNCATKSQLSNQDCLMLSKVFPNVLDKSVYTETIFAVYGTGISLTAIPKVQCFLNFMADSSKIDSQQSTAEDGRISMQFSINSLPEGVYQVICESINEDNTTTAIPWAKQESVNELLIVDSGKLIVTSINPEETRTKTNMQISLTLSEPLNAALVQRVTKINSLMCYLLLKSGTNKQLPIILRATEIQENSKIQCPFYSFLIAGTYSVGVAFTYEAAKENPETMKDLLIMSPAPEIISAEFNSDLTKMLINFNENIEAENSQCDSLFDAETIKLIGEGPQCNFKASVLEIILGQNNKLEPGSKIALSKLSAIRQFGSPVNSPLAKFTTEGNAIINPLDPTIPVADFTVEAPNVICSATDADLTLKLLASNNQRLNYMFASSFDMPAASRLVQTHRERLLLWRGVRELALDLRAKSKTMSTNGIISIDTSMLMAGLTYTILVNTTDQFGRTGSSKEFSLRVPSKNESNDNAPDSVRLDLPPSTYLNLGLDATAEIIRCDSQKNQQNYKFIWILKFMDTETRLSESESSNRIQISPEILSQSGDYDLTVQATMNNKPIEVSKRFRVMGRGLLAVLPAQSITIGAAMDNRSPLIIDGSRSLDLDLVSASSVGLQYQWCCLVIPSNDPKTLGDLQACQRLVNAVTSSNLTIAADKLPLGSYNITVTVSKENKNPASASLILRILTGDPPRVIFQPNSLLSSVNPLQGVTLRANLLGIREGCRYWWEFPSELGFMQLDLGSELGLGDPITILPFDLDQLDNENNLEISLVIPGPTSNWPGLVGGTQYLARAVAECNGNSRGESSVVLKTNSPPPQGALTVTPTTGQGWRTNFTFRAEEVYDENMPVSYQFGYRTNDGGEIETQSFFSKTWLKNPTATTIIPGRLETYSVIPLVDVCDAFNSCRRVESSPITLDPPDQLTEDDVRLLQLEYERMIAEGLKVEALRYAQNILKLLKERTDQTAYQQMSSYLENSILRLLRQIILTIESNPESVSSALEFTDVALDTLSQMQIMSDSIIKELIDLKEKILAVPSGSQSAKIQMGKDYKRTKRQTNSSESTSKSHGLEEVKGFLNLQFTILRSGNSDQVKTAQNKFQGEIRKMLVSFCNHDSVSGGKQQQLNHDSIFLTMRTLKAPVASKNPYKISPNLDINFLDPLASSLNNELKTLDKYCLAGYQLLDPKLALGKDFEHSLYDIQIIERKKGKMKESFEGPIEIIYKMSAKEETSKSNQQLKVVHYFDNEFIDTDCETKPMESKNYITAQCNKLGYLSAKFYELPTTTTVATTVTTTVTEPTTTIMVTEPITTTTVTEPVTTTTVSEATTETTLETTTISTTKIITSSEPTTIPTTTSIPTTTKEVSTNPNKNDVETINNNDLNGIPTWENAYKVTFRIDEDFDKKVGKQRKEFVESLKKQILGYVENMPPRMIVFMNVNPGSIIVTLRLVDTDIRKANEVIPIIERMLRKGEIDLYDLNKKPMIVPNQNLTVSQEYLAAEPDAGTYITIGAGVGFIVILALIVLAAFFCKRQRDKHHILRAHQAAMANQAMPTYKQFHFEQSIDGTEASLARYRSTLPSLGTVTSFLGNVMIGVGNNQGKYSTSNTMDGELMLNVGRKETGMKLNENNTNKETTSKSAGSVEQQTRMRHRQPQKQKTKDESVDKVLDKLPGTPTEDD